MITNTFVFSLLFSLISLSLQAAPHPGLGSSSINQISPASAFSQMGFQLKSIPQDWSYDPILRASESNQDTHDKSTSEQIQIDLIKKKNNVSESIARLSFKSEPVNSKTDLQAYVRKFLRDYNQYGFDAYSLQAPDKNSVVIDVYQKNKKTRSRQAFYKKNSQIIIATCLDEYDGFDKTLVECNQILNSIIWK